MVHGWLFKTLSTMVTVIAPRSMTSKFEEIQEHRDEVKFIEFPGHRDESEVRKVMKNSETGQNSENGPEDRDGRTG